MVLRRLLYIDPGTFWTSHFKKILAQFSSSDVTVDCVGLNFPEELHWPFLPSVPYYFNELFRRVKKGEAEGYDGIIIGCSSDPGLIEAQRLVNIPVIAPLQAALSVASLLGRRVGIIVTGYRGQRKSRPLSKYYDTVYLYGMERRVAGWCIADIDRLSDEEIKNFMESDPRQLYEVIIDAMQRSVMDSVLIQAEKLVNEKGADVIYCSCTLWGGQLEPLKNALKIPVLDPVKTAVLAAAFAVASRDRWSGYCTENLRGHLEKHA